MNNTKPLNKATLKNLKSIGHRLEPIVTIGASGVSASVIEETNRALHDHELIKIKIPAGSKDERTHQARLLATQSQATIVQLIGRTALLYKPNTNPNPKLSNIIRFGV